MNLKAKFFLVLFFFVGSTFAQTTQPRVVASSQIRTVSGNGSTVVTTTGPATAGDCVIIDANGNHVDAGAANACGPAGPAGAAGAAGVAGAAGATGAAGPLANSGGGSNFLWMGYPLTGVSFSTGSLTLTGNAMQTIASSASNSGKRLLVTAWIYNLSGSATTYSMFLSNGTYNIPFNSFVALAIGGSSSVGYYGVVDPGNSYILQCPGSALVSYTVMSFNATDPLKSITGWSALPSGSHVIYTVPAGTTSFFIRANSFTAASQIVGASPFVDVMNTDTTTNISYYALSGGVATGAALGPITAGNIVIPPLFPSLSAGQTVSLNLSTGNVNGVTAYYMVVYERLN